MAGIAWISHEHGTNTRKGCSIACSGNSTKKSDPSNGAVGVFVIEPVLKLGRTAQW
jgi:hypothetical protein